jgi:predicted DNA-binding transcriptional regulator AlpA
MVSSSPAIIGRVPLDLVGVPEIAELLGVSRPTAWRYVRRDDWPEPAAEVRGKRLWKRSDVERWWRANPPSKYDRFRRPSAEAEAVLAELERLGATAEHAARQVAIGAVDFGDGRVRVVSRSAPYNCVADPKAILERLAKLSAGEGPAAVWAALEPLLESHDS